MSWPRFMLNSWFWTFAALSAYWHVAEAINPDADAPFFLWPCFWATWMLVPIIWLAGAIYELWHQRRVDLEERKMRYVDWWADYTRAHHWIYGYRTDGFFINEPAKHVETVVIRCERCGQTRRIWDQLAIDDKGMRWGCATVPVWYRIFGDMRRGWDVNTTPPWVRR